MAYKKNKISIIVPCYNEALRLHANAFLKYAQANPEIDIWFVNDGSTDETLQLLRQISAQCNDNIRVNELPKNVGKAEAIRVTMLSLLALEHYVYIGFLDADLSAPLKEINPLLNLMVEKKLKIVAGARVMLSGKSIQRSALRHYLGRIFTTYSDSILKLQNYDTQCGLKIFDAKFAAQIFDTLFISNWFFDIELFLRARKILGQKEYRIQVVEQPLNEWREVKGSKLKLMDFIKAPFEILKIYKKYH